MQINSYSASSLRRTDRNKLSPGYRPAELFPVVGPMYQDELILTTRAPTMRHILISALLGALGTAVFVMAPPTPLAVAPSASIAPNGRLAPDWHNASWLNTDAPVTLPALKGKVILLNFWVFTCYNCTNTVPSLNVFDKTYRDRGLTIIGIHTPEYPPFAGEHDTNNVAKSLTKYDIHYPVAQDNDRATWDLYSIRYWPSFVLIDKQGRIRHEGYGEFHVGDQWHTQWAARIETLLAE